MFVVAAAGAIVAGLWNDVLLLLQLLFLFAGVSVTVADDHVVAVCVVPLCCSCEPH